MKVLGKINEKNFFVSFLINFGTEKSKKKL